MGVPAFFRWLSRKYPSVIVDCIEKKVFFEIILTLSNKLQYLHWYFHCEVHRDINVGHFFFTVIFNLQPNSALKSLQNKENYYFHVIMLIVSSIKIRIRLKGNSSVQQLFFNNDPHFWMIFLKCVFFNVT